MKLNQKLVIPSIRELIRSTLSFKTNWQLKTPLQKWCYLYGIGRVNLSVLGIPLFNECQDLFWYSYVMYTYSGLYMLLAIYTAFYYISNGDPTKVLPCTCLLIGPICAVRYKYLKMLSIFQNVERKKLFFFFQTIPPLILGHSKNRYLLRELVNFSGYNIYPENHDDIEYVQICSNHINDTIRGYFQKMGLMFLSFLMAVIGPAYAFIFKNIKTTTTAVKFPFIEENSNAEFIGNVLFQSVIACHGIIGYFGMEAAMSIFCDNVTVPPKVIEMELRRLDEKNQQRNYFNSPQMRLNFKNIMKQVMDTEEYV